MQTLRTSTKAIVAYGALFIALATPSASAAVGARLTFPPVAKMWNVFVPGASWAMRSSTTGHLTRFHLQRLTQWGCWRGTIIDLVDTKQSITDYWEIGQSVVGHQIELRESSGAWRMIGTYAQSMDPTDVSQEWTMQVHGYRGMPTPYEIAPARRIDSDTRTAYYTLYSQGIVSTCLRGGPSAAPAWGRNVYWRSRFTFAHNGTLRARYEENGECGAAPCQIEQWTYAPARAGIARITDIRGGGHPAHLTLRRLSPSSPCYWQCSDAQAHPRSQ